MLHDYLATYYKSLSAHTDADKAFCDALEHANAKFLPDIHSYVQTAFTAGDEKTAHELSAVPSTFERIARRYFDVHGREDAQRYDVLVVEEGIYLPIFDGHHIPGIIDLVTYDKDRKSVV